MRGRRGYAAWRRWLAGAMLACAQPAAEAAGPELVVTTSGRVTALTRDALLGHPAITTIKVPLDVAYRRPMTYRAIPVAALLPGAARDDWVRFAARDGFAATIPAALLLATAADGARAYLAVESPSAPWPPLKAGAPATAGPFYLVWLNPEKAHVVAEQWPYQIARVDEVAPLAKRYPALLPASTVHPTDPIQRGLAVFATNCSVCHTLYFAGDAKIGPDLNVPYGPTEYLREESLRRLIRSPQSLRSWPESRMPGFDEAAIGDRDLDDLLAYFYHMAKRKVDAPAP